MLRRIEQRLKKNNKRNKIKNKRDFDVFKKFLKGVSMIKINPVKLLIKKRG